MINDLNDALSFQREQRDIIIKIGAYLAPIKDFIEKSETDSSYADDINNIRRLQSLTMNQTLYSNIIQFLQKYGYSPYSSELLAPISNFIKLVANQTIPRKKLKSTGFISKMKAEFDVMAGGLIILSQISLPQIDINIKAQTPFQAYCFFSNLFSTVKDYIYIIDPYIDASLFYCYFYRLPNTMKIQIASSSDKWNKTIKEQVEAVEKLFMAEYSNYNRKDVPELHDRFIITETSAFQLGGSLKDAAKKSDFSVVKVSKAKRLELIDSYFK